MAQVSMVNLIDFTIEHFDNILIYQSNDICCTKIGMHHFCFVKDMDSAKIFDSLCR